MALIFNCLFSFVRRGIELESTTITILFRYIVAQKQKLYSTVEKTQRMNPSMLSFGTIEL